MVGLERGFGPSKKSHWLNELNNKVVARGKMPLMRNSNLISQSPYNHHESSFFHLVLLYPAYSSIFNDCMY